MNYERFRTLVRGLEKDVVDFKILSHAFASPKLHAGSPAKTDIEAANAELAKDICAMANNGNQASYLIIGVSDDGQNFRSAHDCAITDDRLQSFVKTAIAPVPKVSVMRIRWDNIDNSEISGKEFVIIQIGPQARQAFRLARDFIVWKKKICYRRNEVWLRRNATSDIAQPEEIARLVAGKSAQDVVSSPGNVVYDRLPIQEQLAVRQDDLQRCVGAKGGELTTARWLGTPLPRILLPADDHTMVWSYRFLDKLSKKQDVVKLLLANWAYEHGMMLFLNDGLSQSALEPTYANSLMLRLRERWGHFVVFGNALNPLTRASRSMLPAVPDNAEPISIPVVILTRLHDTDSLTRSFNEAVTFLSTSPETRDVLQQAKATINANLTRWLNEGWRFHTGMHYRGSGTPELEPGQLYDPGKQGGAGLIYNVMNHEDLTVLARNTLLQSDVSSEPTSLQVPDSPTGIAGAEDQRR